MMNVDRQGMTVANDATLENLVQRAQRRLVVLAPGLSTRVAGAVAERWRALGAGSVMVTLDVDPEVCRLGFGHFDSVTLLAETARSVKGVLHHQPGLRIAVVLADDETLIYAPIAQNVEASAVTVGALEQKPNAFRLESPPTPVARDLGLRPEEGPAVIGRETVDRARIQAAEQDLKAVPPQPVDISRLMRVFSARIEFVELKLTGCMLGRRTIEIPGELVGLMNEKTRSLLESKFKLFNQEEAGVWGDELLRLKDHIVDRFLVLLPTYGHVLRRRDKDRFAVAIRALERMVERARQRRCAAIQEILDARVTALEDALLPAVERHPPERWKVMRRLGSIRELLHRELVKRTGTAQSLLSHAGVQVRYKGVTYETLKDPKFIDMVRRLLPDLPSVGDERIVAGVVG